MEFHKQQKQYIHPYQFPFCLFVNTSPTINAEMAIINDNAKVGSFSETAKEICENITLI